MRIRSSFVLVFALLSFSAWNGLAATEQVDDPWIWLEQVEDEKALAWVEKHNSKSISELEIWASVHSRPALWSQRAHRILSGLGGADSELAERALRVAASLAPQAA